MKLFNLKSLIVASTMFRGLRHVVVRQAGK